MQSLALRNVLALGMLRFRHFLYTTTAPAVKEPPVAQLLLSRRPAHALNIPIADAKLVPRHRRLRRDEA